MTPDDPRDAFDLIPKVELHCHVEGTVRLATVAELARKAGRPLPVDDPELLYRYDSLDSFLAVFWLIQELLATRDDWARVAYESLLDAAAAGNDLLLFFATSQGDSANVWAVRATQ